MIIKNVPFIGDKAEKYASCQGPPTTMMILKFFGIDISFEELYKRMKYREGKWFFEAYIVELLTSYKIRCKYYSDEQLRKIDNDAELFKKISGLEFNEKNEKEFDVKHYDNSANFVLQNGLFEKRQVDINFIITQIKEGRLVVVIVDRNKLASGDDYKGHFLLIKGFDKGAFICNDAYLGEGIRIPFDKFKEAFYCVDWTSKNHEKKSHHIVVIG